MPEIQRDWDFHALHGRWPTGHDNDFLIDRLRAVPVEETAAGAYGRVLEVAAAEAIHAAKLSLRGLACIALEPSVAMLTAARARATELGARLTLVRGIGETLPFRDRSFDRVLCESAIDHFADPALGIREMARVLAPDGRLVIGVVNYGGLTVRLARVVYRFGRAVGVLPRDQPLFWDSPVPTEHTFECTYTRLLALCRPHLLLDRTVGVSLGWAFPGWARALTQVSWDRQTRILEGLDALARRMPRLADYVLTVWRLRPAPDLTPDPDLQSGQPGGTARPCS